MNANENARGSDVVGVGVMAGLHEKAFYRTEWRIRRYRDDAAFERGESTPVVDPMTGELLPAESVVEGNILLNEGIGLLLDLLIVAGGTGYNNANARIGVGDSATGESAAHTALQAATNKLWKAMQATYPQRSAQTVTWRSQFTSAEANYAWNEFTITNAADDSGTNLNRKVSAQGTKAGGQTWTVDVAITIS